MGVEKRLVELGLVLPPPPEPIAAYVPAVRTGSLVFVAAQVPKVKDKLLYTGKVGREVTLQQGYEAARACALNALAAVKAEAGSLDRIRRVVRVTGYVASAPGFVDQPRVVNGASELLVQLFGERGRHTRASVGVAELPMNSPVLVDMIVEIGPGRGEKGR